MDTDARESAPPESRDAGSIPTDQPQDSAKDSAMDIDDSGPPPRAPEPPESVEKKDEPAPMQADDDDAVEY